MELYNRIYKHGEQLNAIFHTDLEPVALCKKLRRLETQGEQIALDLCNGVLETDQAHEKGGKLLAKADKLLRFSDAGVPVILNYDPRGYSLKIPDDFVREHNLSIHTDMGGYGIIAPDLRS